VDVVLWTFARWRCELSGDVLDGGQWHERHAALSHLPHFTRLDHDDQQPTAAVSVDAATDGLEEISIS